VAHFATLQRVDITTTRRHHHNTMALPHRINSLQKEGRVALAIHSLQEKQLKSGRTAAKTYAVPRTTIRRLLKGILPKRGSKAQNRLLLECEEAELIK
jgi:hypothetical protein